MSTTKNIIRLVCAHFKVKPAELNSRERTERLTTPRHVAMFLVRTVLALPFETIGRHFGGRDHTTVRNGIECVKDRMSVDLKFKAVVESLQNQIV